MKVGNCLIAISTFQKTNALEVLLTSMLKHGYGAYTIVINDDNAGLPYTVKNPIWDNSDSVDMPSTIEIYNKFKPQFPDLNLTYGKTIRRGVSINKNRGISFFLKETNCDYLLLLDDDQEFIAPNYIEALIEACRLNNLNHITSMWTDKPGEGKLQLSGNTWENDFPVEAQGYNVTFHSGCHGSGNFYSRPCIKKIGYYDLLPGKYSFEHSLHSARAMRFVDKRTPLWYPQFMLTYQYLVGQSIPNNYFDTAKDISLNEPIYKERLKEIFDGLSSKVVNSELKDEVICK